MRQAAWPWPWPGNIDPLVATHETLLSPQHSQGPAPAIRGSQPVERG